MPSYRPFPLAVVCLCILFAPCLAAAQDGTNLLANTGFEDPGADGLPDQWKYSSTGGSKALRDDTTSLTGEASAHLIKINDGESHVAAMAFPRLTVKPGEEYTLSGWAKGQVVPGNANLFLYQYDKDNKWLGSFLSNRVPQTDRWTPVRRTEKLRDDCAQVEVRFEIFGKDSVGEAWVDDVYFGQDSTAPAAVAGLVAQTDGTDVTLTWKPGAGEKPCSYEVFRAPYPRYSADHGAATGFTQTPEYSERLPEGYTQYYAVIALDAALNMSELVFTDAVRARNSEDLPPLVAWVEGPAMRSGPELPWPLPELPRTLSVEMARNEYASAQVFLGASRDALENVRAEVGQLPAGFEAQVFLQEYVMIPGRAQWKPDPLPPVEPVSIEAAMMRGWWVLLKTGEDVAASDYTIPITLTADGQQPTTLSLDVKVWPVTVPRGNHYGGDWGIWGKEISEQEQVDLGSPEYNRLADLYRDFFLEHRMIPRNPPGAPESEAAAEWFTDERVASYTLASTGPWAQLMTDEQLEAFKVRCEYLREKGWLSKGQVYICDEPAEDKYGFVADLCRQVREAGDDVRILLTERPVEALLGHVDIWCPPLHHVAEDLALCEERRQLGEEIWWYVCGAPPPPWPNYLLGNDPIDGRVLSWLQVKHHVSGELYWAVTCFPGDVWEQGLPANWAGDGYLCYPGKPRGLDGPVTCIRAEVIRDAKEDIELIWLLRDLAAKQGQSERAEQVIASALEIVCPDFLKYAKTDEEINRARRLILDAIVELGD